MAATNAELVRQIFDEINKGDLESAGKLLAPGYINYGFPGIPSGPEGFTMVIGMFRSAFPDMNVRVDEVIADGDRVATRGRMTGTHQGEFMGIPASGRSVDIGYIDIWRAEDGKLAENWVEMDRVGLLQQIGAIPAPEQNV
jgi:steroid delta-isomerase-like uncharacterized protein